MVKDMEASLKFYQGLVGLEVVRRFPARPGVEVCFLGTGETKVELICDSNCKTQVSTDGVSLGFGVRSLEETMKLVKEKGVAVHSGPFQPNPKIRFFFVKDPDGFSVQFVERVHAAA
jgi:lactoylglutathione lyase